MDLDRTILPETLELRPRLIDAVRAAAAAGVVPIVATGRMLRSSLPFALRAGRDGAADLLPGRADRRPRRRGEWLRHEPMPVPLAREVIEACRKRDQHCNVYVDDELYVDELNVYALEYARHAKLEAHAVGDLERWLTEPTTKIVVVGEPELLDTLQIELRAQFGDRLFIAKSLPFFLEVAAAGRLQGQRPASGCATASRIEPAHVVSFGDGANDIELLRDAGFGVAVEGADQILLDEADATVPGPEHDGVARFLEALVSARS